MLMPTVALRPLASVTTHCTRAKMMLFVADPLNEHVAFVGVVMLNPYVAWMSGRTHTVDHA